MTIQLTEKQIEEAKALGSKIAKEFDPNGDGHSTKEETLAAMNKWDTLFYDELTSKKISYYEACWQMDNPRVWPRLVQEFELAKGREQLRQRDNDAYIEDIRTNGFNGRRLSATELEQFRIASEVINQHIHTYEEPTAEEVCRHFGFEKKTEGQSR